MNRFLASAIGKINALVAWAMIIGLPIGGGIFGGMVPVGMGGTVSFVGGAVGFLAGLLLGFISAVLVCGTLALLIDIRDSLREILRLRKRGTADV